MTWLGLGVRSAVLGGACAGLAAVAGGPSFQAVYEGDVRFEHCYALDQGPASVAAKKECWRDWLHDYTYGQSRDRVEYAGTRVSELSLDPTLPSEDVSARRPARTTTAPVPTNAFAPPPNTVDRTASSSEAATGVASAQGVARPTTGSVRAPGEDCADGCSTYWKACRSGCKTGGCDACDKAYKLCVPGCFRK